MLIWTLESNRNFSVKSFYHFLVDGGICNPLYSLFWKIGCSSKVTLFCWLGWDNKVLTLTNLAKKGCNLQCATDTCVLCHRCPESVDHLLLKCNFIDRIWHFFKHTLGLLSHPHSTFEIRTTWIPSLHSQLRPPWSFSWFVAMLIFHFSVFCFFF